MTVAATQPEDTASPELDRFAVLDELARQALRMAGLLMAQAEAVAADGEQGTPEAVEMLERLSRAHARVTRTVRLSFLLKDALLKSSEDRAKAASSDRNAQVYKRKSMLGNVIERIAKDAGYQKPYVVSGVARDRLDRDEIYGDVLTRPASEIIALICKDLDLDPDWSKLAVEAWATGEIKAGALWPPSPANDSKPPDPPPSGEGDHAKPLAKHGGGGEMEPPVTPPASSLASPTASGAASPSTASRFPSPDGGGSEACATPQ